MLGNASMLEFGTLDVGAGRFFSEMEVVARLPVVVLNYALARELAPMRDPYSMVGQEVYVRDRARRVIGVMTATELEDTENPSFALYAPIAAASALLDPPPTGRFSPVIQMLAPNVESVDDLREVASDWLSRRCARWNERVRVDVGREQLQQVERGFLTQFLTESVAIALVGATAGLTLGLLFAWGIAALFRAMSHVPISPVLSPGSVLIAIVSSSLVGLVFGTYPARRASELSPVVAIAHE